MINRVCEEFTELLRLQHPALAGATRLFKRWMSSQSLVFQQGTGQLGAVRALELPKELC